MMKYLTITAALLLLAAPAATKSRLPPVAPYSAAGLTVHEWGVFRVNEDVEYANADLRALWDDLPPFAYGHIRGRLVPQSWGAYEIRKNPVIFFHAKQPAHVHLRVAFPGGMAGVWFPATIRPSVEGGGNEPKAGSTLEWDVAVGKCPDGWRPKLPNFPEAPERHWVSDLRRDVKCDEVFTKFGYGETDVEREKFVYYDGIFPQGKWLKFDVTRDGVAITNRVKHPVFNVTVVDRRGDKPRIGRIARLEPGAAVKEVSFTEIDASRFASEASATLVKQLVSVGLHEDEANSLSRLWRKDMFETPGLHAFYCIPQSEYDRLMPLAITPQPEAVTRVGLVYHGHLEPDFAERVLALVKQLDADTFARRDAAAKKLVAIGPAALVELKRLQKRKGLSVEVRERLDALVKRWNAADAFDTEARARP